VIYTTLMASNGKLPDSTLTPIPPGKLENSAARAWKAGPGKAGCRLTGPNSGYRSYAMQVYYWNLYQSGRGNLAARPGTLGRPAITVGAKQSI
jgi:hypothetical protein